MTPADLHDEMRRLSGLLDAGVKALTDAGVGLAQAEHDYRRAVAEAWTRAPEGTVPEREAWVGGECAPLRLRRDTAEAMRQAALEAVRSRRTQLSSAQTLANALKADLDMHTYGQDHR